MKSFRLWALSALTFLAVGLLQADTLPVDPTIKFKTGGSGSTDITDTNCPTTGCLISTFPEVIGADGQASLDIKNLTSFDITGLIFYIPTSNFNQDFNASTDAFQSASIFGDEAHLQIIAAFFGVGPGTGGSAFLPADPSAPSGSPGFVPGQPVTLQAFFGFLPPDAPLKGLPIGAEGNLGLATVPEPGMFWTSLIGFAGLLVVRRRVRSN